jgi:threonine dehydrogenase-like Zn-dependent dehydrogenase
MAAAGQIAVATFDGPGARPVMRTVPRPAVGRSAALFTVAACGVCGTDLHILAGHWPKPLPWPFTLGHEVAGIIDEIGPGLTHDYMGNPLRVGDKVMIPPLMPCGECDWCRHYPKHANKCLKPVYYGRYIGFAQAPHLWGGWAEMEYLDLEMLPGTKVYRLPDEMPLWLGTLAEPFTSCIRGFKRAQQMDQFSPGATVVIQGSGPIGVLAVVAALEMGAGRVIVVGAPEVPRLALCRAFGAAATVDITHLPPGAARIEAVRALVGGYGADVVMDCSGHPSAGPEGIEMLRDGGTYIEMGQFTDAGAVSTNWHRMCTKDITIIGSWAFTADDIWTGIVMLNRARDRYNFRDMQMHFPFSEEGISAAITAAREMRCVKATIVPRPDLLER